MSSFNADQLKELENFFDDRYVMQSDCNERQQGIDKKFANDDKRIDILINKTKTWDKLLWAIASTGIGALIAEIINLIKG